MAQCIASAAFLLAAILVSAAPLVYVSQPSSDTTTVFDTGRAAPRHANPLVPWLLGLGPLLLPLAALFIATTLSLTSIFSYACRLTLRMSATSRTVCHVPRGDRAAGLCLLVCIHLKRLTGSVL